MEHRSRRRGFPSTTKTTISCAVVALFLYRFATRPTYVIHQYHYAMPLPGGYFPIRGFETDPDVREAASFAFRELLSRSAAAAAAADTDDETAAADASSSSSSSSSSAAAAAAVGIPREAVFYEVLGASKQVVAGINVRVELEFLDASRNVLGGGTAVVYNRFGDVSVTGWKAKTKTTR